MSLQPLIQRGRVPSATPGLFPRLVVIHSAGTANHLQVLKKDGNDLDHVAVGVNDGMPEFRADICRLEIGAMTGHGP